MPELYRRRTAIKRSRGAPPTERRRTEHSLASNPLRTASPASWPRSVCRYRDLICLGRPPCVSLDILCKTTRHHVPVCNGGCCPDRVLISVSSNETAHRSRRTSSCHEPGHTAAPKYASARHAGALAWNRHVNMRKKIIEFLRRRFPSRKIWLLERHAI